MANEIAELSFDDFGFSNTTQTVQDSLSENFIDAKPEEVQEIKLEETPKQEEVKIDILDELSKEDLVVPDDNTPPVEEPSEGQEPLINQIKAFANVLTEEGIITLEDGEEIEDGDQLIAKVRQEGQKIAFQEFNSILSKFGKDYYDAFQAIYVNGVNPKDYFQTQERLESVRNLDITEEENQELVVRQNFKLQGYSDARIKIRIQGFKDLGTLEEEAAEAHQLLIETEEKTLQQLEQVKLQEQQTKQQEEAFYNHSVGQIINQKLQQKEIDGIPLSKKDAEILYDFTTSKRWKLPSGEEITEFDKFWLDLKRPENYELRIKVAALAMNNFDTSKIAKKEVSKEISKKFDFLTQKEKTATRTNTKVDSFSVNYNK